MTKPANYAKNVFINCPFDDDYYDLRKILLFTVTYLGFTPRISLEISDSGEIRLDKIIRLIKESRYSIHDLSRLQAKSINEYYRLNMPFELGIDYGLRKFNSRYRDKKMLILEKSRFDYMKAISDINGFDIKDHNNDLETLVNRLRSWFAETTGVSGLIGSAKVYSDYFDFQRDLFLKKMTSYKTRHKSSDSEAEHFAKDEVKNMTIPEYIKEIVRWKKN
ncbi:MAG TPA: hypothetical protein VFG10_14205 [Saprospiraceae bacterium]|nr:hypothetical protein [Saprospiraceae bacterium]